MLFWNKYKAKLSWGIWLFYNPSKLQVPPINQQEDLLLTNFYTSD